MRILHLFSNWKWTGPAEPAVNLAATLARRGHSVDLAVGQAPRQAKNFLLEQARARGLEPWDGLRLGKHRHPLDNALDVRTLRRRLEEQPYDIVHAHLDNDHLIAGRALSRLGRPVPLVRSFYGGDPEQLRYLPRLLSVTDGLLCVSSRVIERVSRRTRFDPSRVFHVEGAVDLERFRPLDGIDRTRAGDLVVGVVARMQTHRRFELLLDAFVQVAGERSDVSFRVIGRGTNQKEVAIEPVRDLGLADRVSFLGYLPGEEYVRALHGLSVLVYLVPGSDGSCRTVREGMAVGLPVIASRRGILRELVRDGVEGLSVEEDAGELARAILRLAGDRALLGALSAGALREARQRFSLTEQAERVEAIYAELLRMRETTSRSRTWG